MGGPPEPPPLSWLTVCVVCRARRVSPVAWAERGRGTWWYRLRCGECGTRHEVVVAEAEAERYELDLQDAADEIAETLHAFERECMLAEGRCWTRALELDLVDARDFQRDSR